MTTSRHGLFLVDKPAGPTSHDVVQAARRALKERRIGHTGTLDPAATGLLVLCVGRATRLQQYLLAWEKTYIGEIRLGQATTTYDTEGEPVGPQMAAPTPDAQRLRELEARFSGEIHQLPPSYSAKKTGGRKFYELARAGEAVPLEPKRVTIHSLRLEDRGGELLGFEVTCSSGTYVRSLAHDLGAALGCGGHLAWLRRVRIGPWSVEEAINAELLARRGVELDLSAFVPLTHAVLPFPEVILNPVALDHFCHGQEVMVRDLETVPAPGGSVTVRNRAGELAGIGVALIAAPRARTATIGPRMVFAELESPARA
jgi:tRNA pseudouridine55 synthase